MILCFHLCQSTCQSLSLRLCLFQHCWPIPSIDTLSRVLINLFETKSASLLTTPSLPLLRRTLSILLKISHCARILICLHRIEHPVRELYLFLLDYSSIGQCLVAARPLSTLTLLCYLIGKVWVKSAESWVNLEFILDLWREIFCVHCFSGLQSVWHGWLQALIA